MAQTPITVEYRWVERSGQTSIGPGAVPASSPTNTTATDATIWFVLEARVVTTDPAIRGIGGFAGSVTVADPLGDAGGAFKVTAGGRNAAPTNAFPTLTPPTGFPQALGSRGVYAPFRLVADLNEQATGTIAVVAGQDAITQIVGATGGAAIDLLTNGDVNGAAFGLNSFAPIYAFEYDVTNLGARTINFGADLQLTAFSSVDANNVPNALPTIGTVPVCPITVVPAPGAAALLGLGGLVAVRRRR